MKKWLFKTEPSTWSWDNQVESGTECWNGVRNYQAANNMKKMKIGDLGFFYHSVTEKAIVGIVEIVKEYYQDDTDLSGRFVMVDIKAVRPVEKAVSLKDIKNNPRLENMVLVKQQRLSVSPVTDTEWLEICKMAKIKNPPK